MLKRQIQKVMCYSGEWALLWCKCVKQMQNIFKLTALLHIFRFTILGTFRIVAKAPNTFLVSTSIFAASSGQVSTKFDTGKYVEIKCQLDATEVFIADLIACSTCFGHHYAHHQEPKSIIQWLLPVVFRAVVFKLLVWCGAEGYVSGLQDAAASCKPDT